MLNMKSKEIKELLSKNRSNLIITSDIIPKASCSMYYSVFKGKKTYAREEFWTRIETDTIAIVRINLIQNHIGYDGECITLDWE